MAGASFDAQGMLGEDPMQTLDHLIRSHPFWQGVNPRYFHILNECAAFAKFGVEQPIFRRGVEAEHFYLICSGQVALETFVPGKGAITIDTLGPGEALGWSWLFPPYRWHFSARSVDFTEMITFSVHELRKHAEENHDFGYELTTRVGQVVLERLQATRLQLLEFYATPGE
jgi:CRP/FNR family cyclic AMP-dependent transcriptional regulator